MLCFRTAGTVFYQCCFPDGDPVTPQGLDLNPSTQYISYWFGFQAHGGS